MSLYVCLLLCSLAPCLLGHNAPFIRFLILALYLLFACLYRMLPHLSFFLHFFLTFLLPYLSFPLRIDPLHFQAGCHKRRLNLALGFLCSFCVVVHFFWLVNACICCVRFGFFHTKPRDWLGETSPKWPLLCRVVCKTTTQTMNQLCSCAGFSFFFFSPLPPSLQPCWSCQLVNLQCSCCCFYSDVYSACIKVVLVNVFRCKRWG